MLFRANEGLNFINTSWGEPPLGVLLLLVVVFMCGDMVVYVRVRVAPLLLTIVLIFSAISLRRCS